MAQETRVEETRCSLQTFERNRYFYGKPMTVSDFEAEQRYLIGKHRYINRLVHGAGVLCGLRVTLPESFSAERPTVELTEGAALDCCGNLIVVSRSGTAEVKGEFNPSGLNYLYIKYNECSKQPVMLAANGSSCEEVCCYNRIQETFEIVASRTAPGGGEAAAPSAATPSNAVAAGGSPPDAETVCRGLAEQYYQEHLRTCPGCDDPLVFLASLDLGKGVLDETETARYRSVVYNNPMLHGLLCDHVTDYENPHRTSAEQVRALQSVNGVGNSPTRSFVSDIELRSPDNTIGITPNTNDAQIELVLAPDAVSLSHLNREVFENLLQSSETITVQPNVGGRSIKLHAAGGSQTPITSGFFDFENVLPQEVRTSSLISHKLESGQVAVVLAQEELGGLHLAGGSMSNPLNVTARFGDVTAFSEDAPSLMAEVDSAQQTIRISLKDRRQGSRLNAKVTLTDESEFRFAATVEATPPGETETAGIKDPSGALPPPETGGGIIAEPEGRTYRVRWWAIPA
jgi:hypothetical protein